MAEGGAIENRSKTGGFRARQVFHHAGQYDGIEWVRAEPEARVCMIAGAWPCAAV